LCDHIKNKYGNKYTERSDEDSEGLEKTDMASINAWATDSNVSLQEFLDTLREVGI
jgi:hypothetical protein